MSMLRSDSASAVPPLKRAAAADSALASASSPWMRFVISAASRRCAERFSGAEIELMTVMWFRDLASVKAFAGADHEAAYVPQKARAVLARFDARSQHYEIRERREA